MEHKKEMIQMIKEIENDKIIKILYNFVKSFYKDIIKTKLLKDDKFIKHIIKDINLSN